MCFRNHFFINLIAHTLRARDCQFDSFVVTDGTVSCHYDKLRCHRWWRGCRVDDLLFSEYDIALYILALFICRILAFGLMLFVVHTTLNKFYLILRLLFQIQLLNENLFWIFPIFHIFALLVLSVTNKTWLMSLQTMLWWDFLISIFLWTLMYDTGYIFFQHYVNKQPYYSLSTFTTFQKGKRRFVYIITQ